MPPHRVTRLRDLLDATGKEAPSARKQAAWLGLIVESVTATGSQNRWFPVPVACLDCEAEAYRPLAVRCVGPGIEWLCTHCHASGTITGWSGSIYDLSAQEDQGAEAASIAVFTRLEELETARRTSLPSSLRVAFASASLHRDHILLVMTQDELAQLLDHLNKQATTLTGKARYALERLLGRCDAALLMLEQQGAEPPPTLH